MIVWKKNSRVQSKRTDKTIAEYSAETAEILQWFNNAKSSSSSVYFQMSFAGYRR